MNTVLNIAHPRLYISYDLPSFLILVTFFVFWRFFDISFWSNRFYVTALRRYELEYQIFLVLELLPETSLLVSSEMVPFVNVVSARAENFIANIKRNTIHVTRITKIQGPSFSIWPTSSSSEFHLSRATQKNWSCNVKRNIHPTKTRPDAIFLFLSPTIFRISWHKFSFQLAPYF